jgi:hypothetical protein
MRRPRQSRGGRPRPAGRRRTALTLAVALGGALLSLGAFDLGAKEPASPSPADIRLEWVDGGAPVEGEAGQTVEIPYHLRNVGGQDAFAVLLRAHTALGPLGRTLRLEPGPRAGETMARQVSLPLAEGVRELCLEATLQNLTPSDPSDPDPRDNRICRGVRVRPAQRTAPWAGGAAP